jgi:allantoinase
MIGEDDRYDYGHFEFIMRGIQGARADARAGQADLALLHCETAEVMTAYTKLVEKDKSQKGLAGLQRVAPAALRRAGGVHRQLPGQRDGAAQHQPAAPELAQGGAGRDDDGRRVSAHRLQARGDHRPPDAGHHSKAAELAKVNPPIRPREDVEFLWEALLAGELDWVVSDHACCRMR